MNPPVSKLKEWARYNADGNEVTIPASAWDSILWILGLCEKIEGNKHVQKALRKAAA